MEANPGNLARFEAQRARLVEQIDTEKEAALELAARLAEVSLTIPQRVGESERLYGSVTNAVIAQALEEQGLTVDRKQLELDEPIKQLGTYQITVRLAPEVKAQIQVEVVPEAS
jgi:large subunit ribosomal protein L9